MNEITAPEAAELSVELKRRIAVFDWWIMNGDRTLSESGGNPNIIWDMSIGCPYLIDHNLAFDSSLSLPAMEREHIFGSLLSEIIDDPSLQKPWSERLGRCLARWDNFCDALPERWSYLDDQLTVPSGFAPATALINLQRFDTPAMWSRP